MEYIWTPHIMAHSTIMWCGNGRETTCHCGWERDSRAEAKAQSQTSAAVHLQPLSISVLLSVCLCHLSFSCFLIPVSLIAFQISHVSYFSLIFPDFSTLTLLPLEECPAQAKAILWLFFERVYFMPLYNMESRLNQWQSRELKLKCLYFWFLLCIESVLLEWKLP